MFGKNVFLQLWSKMFSTNLIALFFDHQHLWKESIHTFDFLQVDNHKGKVGSETTIDTTDPLRLSFNQIAGFFDRQYL